MICKIRLDLSSSDSVKKVAIKIGSNIASLQAQRRLGEATSSLEKVYERLSSGQRINRASDDAAGLAISEKLNADSKVFSQGIRNINDSLSMFAITEQATSSLKGIITRSKELAEQSANGVYSTAQRTALNNELQALGDEYNRILATTKFNDRQIFARDDNPFVTQAGNSQLFSSLSNQRAIEVDQISRVSVGYDGSEANAGSSTNLYSRGVINSDGRYVLFESIASNIIANDANGATGDVYLQDQRTGEITLVSTSAAGVQANGNSVISTDAISADGRYVLFSSLASNLVSGDTNGFFDIYRKDLHTGEIQLASSSTSGQISNGNVTQHASLSADGRYAVFQTNATNLASTDLTTSADIYRKDFLTGELIHVSTSNIGGQSSGSSVISSVSADGRYVLFASSSTDILASDSNGSVSDIIRKDMLTGQVALVSSSSSGTQGDANANQARMSADGRYVVFGSTSTNLVSGDTNGLQDIFRKDLLTGETVMVTTSESGAIATGGTSTISSISSDGRYVLFESAATNLVTGDTNGSTDIFVKDMQTGQVRRVNVSESGDQASSVGGGAIRSAISSDGKFVTFRSSFTDQLDGSATTTSRSHVYTTSTGFSENYQLTKFQWMDVQTQNEARKTLSWLDQYESELNNYLGQIGATTSRMSTALSVLGSVRENYKAAESRIKDADMAAESATLVRTQILQQAAASVLAQANQSPALALQLLN